MESLESRSEGATAGAEPSAASEPGSSAPVIELDGLSLRFGKVQALDQVSVALSGRAIGLLGPNGAGKTSLVHTLLGFHRPSAGRATVLGWDVARQGRELKAQVGYMPERDAFVSEMTGVHFVRLMGELSGLPPQVALERAHEMLFYVGLGEARYRKIGTYSLGMKQMAKLAQALVHGPRLIILDEPTNGLDPSGRQRMLDLITSIRDRGEARILISSHLLRDVEAVCDEVVVLKAGRVVAYRDLEAERRSNRSFLEIEVRGGRSSFAEAIAGLGCEVAVHGKRRLKVVLPEAVSVSDLYRIARDQETQVRRLIYKRDSLEDIFLQAMEVDHGSL